LITCQYEYAITKYSYIASSTIKCTAKVLSRESHTKIC